MEKSSSNKKIKRTIGGLVFHPKDKKAYKSVHAWLKAGKPDNVYVYDHVDTLKVMGFPICDGAFVRGMYRRMPTLKPKTVELTIIPEFIRELKPAEVKSKSGGIFVAETKDHHKMVY